MKKLTLLTIALLLTLLIPFSISAQTPTAANQKINWLTIEQAIQMSKKDRTKKFFIDIYTDWCGWCKKMDKETFQNPEVVKYINENYYAVKFNAEQKESFAVADKTYKFVEGGRRGYHEFAVFLTSGRMGFPTVAFLDENFNVIQAIPGYREVGEFGMIASYFRGDHHKRTAWATYQKNYRGLSDANKK